jgi:flagellar protein FlbD
LIPLTQFNGHPIYINADLIETLETTPDTVITLTNGKKHLVQEPAEEVVARIAAYKAGQVQPETDVSEVDEWISQPS